MTTLLKIENASNSNGAIGIVVKGSNSRRTQLLSPGEKTETWLGGHQEVSLTEFWPSHAPPVSPMQLHAEYARRLIETEVNVQNKKWGEANERSDVSGGELLRAAIAQATAVARASEEAAAIAKAASASSALETTIDYMAIREEIFAGIAESIYPLAWSMFRDYGSDIANLVVAAAYIENEIKRRLAAGEDTYRTARGETYKGRVIYDQETTGV